MTQKKKGFTLIELVVVMAIIAVLAALMVTAIVAARKAATNTQITGNAKTIETALETYSTKNSGKYPSSSQQANGDVTLLSPVASPSLTASGVVNFLRNSEALSGGPAGLGTYQIIYQAQSNGSGYTLTACDVANANTDAWITTTLMTGEGTASEVGITPGKVNFLGAKGPCKAGSVIYSTAR